MTFVAVERKAGDPASGILILCDHASSSIPEDLHQLGLEEDVLTRHVAYDIGARNVTLALAQSLNAPALLTTFSRLIIDPNRGLLDPTLIMQLSDRAIIPGNACLTQAQKEERIKRFYKPYDAAIAQHIQQFFDAGITPVIISIHSFTPCWQGQKRPWHIGLLWEDECLARPLREVLDAPDLCLGDNEPYRGGLPGDTLNRHAKDLPNVLIELRQDLISTKTDARIWGKRLGEALLRLPIDRLRLGDV